MKKKLIKWLSQLLLKLRENDDEPYLALKTTGISPDGLMGFELEWNDVAVDNLQKNGYLGATPQAIVEEFFVHSIFAAHANSLVPDQPTTKQIESLATSVQDANNSLKFG